MPVSIQKGAKPPVAAKITELTAENIRDMLLSLPDSERGFIVTNPLAGEKKVYSIARDATNGRIAINCKDEAET